LNWDAISAVAEILASLGVMISLIYLGLQIRNQTIEARLESGRELASQLSDIYADLSTDMQLSALWVKGLRDFASLDVSERVRFSAYMGRVFRFLEAVFHQHSWGKLDDTVWRGLDASLKDVCLYPGTRDWWRTRKHWFSQEYASHVERYLVDPSSPRLYGEK